MLHKNLSSILNQVVEVLELENDGAGNYSWKTVHRRWAAVELDTGRNLFSSVGIGARGATVTMRYDPELSLHHALCWNGQFLFLTSLVLGECRDRLELKAALCEPVTLTAKPQARTGRDELNRPTAVEIPSFTFPGILTEKYRANEPEDVYRVTTLRRVLVTPKAVQLRPSDLVEVYGETPYIVRQVLDLDPWKNEYEIERMEDV